MLRFLRGRDELAGVRDVVSAVNAADPEVAALDDQGLAGTTSALRERVARGEPLDEVMVGAFAAAREAARRVLGMRPVDEQVGAAVVLHRGGVAEMQTGEGKTLAATLPAYLRALGGEAVHVATVNDYLARRDAEWMGPLYRFLGIEVGAIEPTASRVERRRAYRAGVTYARSDELGFDHLRDRRLFAAHERVLRGLDFVIVDEADSILIDAARTPLVLCGPGSRPPELYARADGVAARMRRDLHYEVDEETRTVTLTADGEAFAESALGEDGALDGSLYDDGALDLLTVLQQCMRAHALFRRDVHYVVSDGRVVLVDERTGRPMPEHRYRDGLHQALEVKERVRIGEEEIVLGTISYQRFFRLYRTLAGMTATASSEADELRAVYGLQVSAIPTHRPRVREDHDDLFFRTEREKLAAVADEIERTHGTGRPVLCGAPTVEKAEALSRELDRRGLTHALLTAKRHDHEAEVVARAGQPGAITVTTPMAGRGTDIVLGDGVAAAGGLHVIGTERHESRRVDDQLKGRAGRRGDPGSSRFFVALEDDVVRLHASPRVSATLQKLASGDGPLEHRTVGRAIEEAQRRAEDRHRDARAALLAFDDVVQAQQEAFDAHREAIRDGRYRREDDSSIAVPEALHERVRAQLERMILVHGAPVPPKGATAAEVQRAREAALAGRIDDVRSIRFRLLERDVTRWFGCRTSLEPYRDDPRAALATLVAVVLRSLAEQRARLDDAVDRTADRVAREAVPEGSPIEPAALVRAARRLGLDPAAIVARLASPTDPDLGADEVARALTDEAREELARAEEALGPHGLARLHRNRTLEELDRRFVEHVQAMVQLRELVALRRIARLDPKRELEREGYALFRAMLEDAELAVISRLLARLRAFRQRTGGDAPAQTLLARARRRRRPM